MREIETLSPDVTSSGLVECGLTTAQLELWLAQEVSPNFERFSGGHASRAGRDASPAGGSLRWTKPGMMPERYGFSVAPG
jgi:hypothetical protein